MNFKSKLIAGIAIIQISVLMIYISFNYHLIKTSLNDELAARANNITTLLANVAATPVLTSDIATLEAITRDITSENDIEFIQIIDNGENILLDSRPSIIGSAEPANDKLIVIDAFIGEKDFIVGEIKIGFSNKSSEEKLNDALSKEINIAIISIFVTLLIAYALGTFLTRRLKTLEQGARHIQQGNLGFQVDGRGNDEISKTAQSFNMMSQHINELYSEQNRVNILLSTLNNVQTKFIQTDNPNAIFDELLDEIIEVTDSQFGFIGEVLKDKNREPYLHTFSITDISWNDETPRPYEDNKQKGLILSNLDTLFGATIKSGLPVISNSPQGESRSVGLPEGHPVINSFLGMPLYSGSKLIGMIGLANRERGYDQKLIEELNALWQVSASIITAYDTEKDRQKFENELRESEERFSLVAKGTNDGMWDWDLKTGEIYYSSRWREMLGYSDQVITNRFDEWQSLIHPDDLGDALATWTDCMEGNLQTFSFEYRLLHKDSDFRWILCRGTVFKDGTNKAIRMAGSHTDITRQKEDEIALKESAQRTQAIFDNVSDIILTLNMRGDIEECNRAIAKSFQYTAEEVIGKNITVLVNMPEGASHNLNNIKKSFQIDNEAKAFRKDGSVFPIDLDISDVIDERGEERLILVIRDITERKKTETAIRKAHEAAIDAAKTKSEFLANMSHEIRTPLHGILGTLQLTERTTLNEKQQSYISTATKSASHLLEIINDILDFSKIEAGKLELEYVPFNLRELLEDVTRLYAPQAQSKGIELEQFMPASFDDNYYGDPARLKQIFNNLVSNAVKFTSDGSVVIKVDILSQMGDETTMKIEVVDSGIGISKSAQEKIFSSFQQADTTTTRKFGGTGLGLAICKQLAELMEGELTIESKEGVGSRFILGITLMSSENKSPYDFAPLNNKRALIVDTNQAESITNKVITDYLSHWKLENTLCDSPDEVQSITLIEEHIDYLFAYDSQLSELCLTRYRQELGEDACIIIVCEAGSSNDKINESNKTIYIEKPIRQSEIYNSLIGSIAEELKVFGSHHYQDHEAIYFEGDILLVEDNPVNQEVSGEVLKQLGLTVDIADNGLQAIEAVRKKQYDLILMDCQMPEMDGFEATLEIRKLERQNILTKNNIIALTANAMKGDREKCLAVGMNDYLTKPFTNKSLVDTLKRWMAIQTKTDECNSSSNANNAGEKEDREIHMAEIIDYNIVNGLKKILKDRFTGMVEKFETNAQKLLIDMREANERKDDELLRRSAHTLKGSSGTLGAQKLQEVCLELEKSAKAGDFSNTETLIKAVEEEYARFEACLPELKVA